MTRRRSCWCGNTTLEPFGPQYGACRVCGTLVSQAGLDDDALRVIDDETDFYGKQYWLRHQQEDLGLPQVGVRVRNDPAERNLHWLRTLLKFRPAPAQILELGCGHGSFVALMRQAGYDARGVEMSPWIVDFARRTFGIPIEVGPVEVLDVPRESLDVIVLMDVLEHLADPLETIGYCLRLLRPDGLLIVQTPSWDESLGHEEMLEKSAPFLHVLQPEEHLYLMSRRSVSAFANRLGVNHLQFEPAIFAHYDMCVVLSRSPLVCHDRASQERALQAAPHGWIVQALLDVYDREFELRARLTDSEHDRSARGEQIEVLTRMVRESEADRAARGEQIDTLTRLVKESEADRAARGEQIVTLTRMVHEANARAEQALQGGRKRS